MRPDGRVHHLLGLEPIVETGRDGPILQDGVDEQAIADGLLVKDLKEAGSQRGVPIHASPQVIGDRKDLELLLVLARATDLGAQT